MRCGNSKSKTQAAEALKEIFRDYMSDSENELLEKKVVNCLAEYDGFVFDGDRVNNTIMNSLGKNRVEYLMKFRKK